MGWVKVTEEEMDFTTSTSGKWVPVSAPTQGLEPIRKPSLQKISDVGMLQGISQGAEKFLSDIPMMMAQGADAVGIVAQNLSGNSAQQPSPYTDRARAIAQKRHSPNDTYYNNLKKGFSGVMQEMPTNEILGLINESIFGANNPVGVLMQTATMHPAIATIGSGINTANERIATEAGIPIEYLETAETLLGSGVLKKKVQGVGKKRVVPEIPEKFPDVRAAAAGNLDAALQAKQNAKSIGVKYSRKLSSEIGDAVTEALMKPDSEGAHAPQERAFNSDILENFSSFTKKGKELTIDDIETVNKRANSLRSKYQAGSDEQRIINDLKYKIRDASMNKENIKGTSKGVEELQKANQLFQKHYQLKDVGNILYTADRKQNSASYIVGELDKMLGKDNSVKLKSRGYSPETIAGMEKVVQDYNAGRLLKNIANPTTNAITGAVVGANTGGVAGAIVGRFAGEVGGSAIGKIRDRLQRNKMRPVVRSIMDRDNHNSQIPLTEAQVREIIAQEVMNNAPRLEYSPQPTPPPDIAVSRSGNAAPLSLAEQQRINYERGRQQDIGLSPDVRAAQETNLQSQLLERYGNSELGQEMAANNKLPLSEAGAGYKPPVEYTKSKVDAMFARAKEAQLQKSSKKEKEQQIEQLFKENAPSIKNIIDELELSNKAKSEWTGKSKYDNDIFRALKEAASKGKKQ
jgi:hypothetical protein